MATKVKLEKKIALRTEDFMLALHMQRQETGRSDPFTFNRVLSRIQHGLPPELH